MILVIVPADGNFPNYPARACASRGLCDLAGVQISYTVDPP